MSTLQRWFGPDFSGEPLLVARWVWLRALGAIHFSAFYSLAFQIHGLIGPNGILPAAEYLPAVRRALGAKGYWLAPSLLWLGASNRALTILVVAGFIASVALMLNLWPRMAIAVAGAAFLSFVAAAQDFSSYQSDGMLLEASFLSLFFAPPGLRPGLAAARPPSRASRWLLRWEWFRIYFESGLVKILSGEPQWRNLTAMDKYYENGPLPTWIGWHAQQLPHGFHAASAGYTLLVELFLCWLLFFGRRSRLLLFALTTPLQIGIILTANYAFLNYLVLMLGVLLVDDEWLSVIGYRLSGPPATRQLITDNRQLFVPAIVLTTHAVTTTLMFFSPALPTAILLEPTRIVNNFGLFAVMTRARYEIEFQGTADGRTWVAYPFRYKPQDPQKPPRIYAPYQPRFDWNLWFASLGVVEDNQWVMNTEVRLMQNEPTVLRLFAGNPFASRPPAAIRAVEWQYWFTTREERARSGAWWRRQLRGSYAPTARRADDGSIRFEVE